MDTDRLSKILRETADEIPTQPPILPVGSAPRGRVLAIPAIVVLLAVGTIGGMVALGDGNDDRSTPIAEDRSASPQLSRVGHNGVSVEVPASWPTLKASDCSEGGLSTDAVIQLDGSLEQCVGYRAAAGNRVYITGLDNPPFGEPWKDITTAALSSNNVPIQQVTSGSLVGMNSTATLALTVPDRDVAIVATGPDLDVIMRIMESVRVD